MPIDLTRSSAEKSSSSSRSSFATSNSLYSFHQQHKVGSGSSGGTSFSLSSSHHPISSSKSSNCLSDTLIEDEALIEKLFPKCRPKSSKTTTTTSSSSAKSSTERTNGGTAPASAVAASYQQKNSVEMLNKADQGGQEGPPLPSQPPSQMPPSAAVRKGGAVRKSGFNACHPPTYHHHSNVPSRRLWNFMDISPSPSPPPLSPVEPVDCPGGAQRYEHHDQPLQCEAAQYTGTSQERPSPVGEQYQSATSTTSGYDGSSSSSNCRDHFKSTTKGGRFDINSLELNRVAPQEKNASTNAFKGDHRYYGDVPPMEKVPSARSASQSHSKHAAHFRLDSLLLSPDDPQPYKAPNSKSQQQQQLSNGIKKSNRFTLDVDDEDDVLFSRFHHHSSNGQPRPAASSTAAAIPASSKNFLKDSSNSYLIDSHRSSRERSAEATVMPTTVMSAGSRRETSVESTRSSRARALREELVDACARELVSKLPPQASSGPAATTMTAAVASSHCRMVKEDVGSISDNEDDDDDNGGFKAAGTTTNTATTATTTSNISTGARNRIELAGGRELFSSSRSMRSKRRSSNHAATSGHGQSAKTNAELQQQQQHHQQPYQASSQATTVSSRRSGSNSSFISRHTQLYSVSMATEGGANEAAPTSQHSELSSSVAGESTAAAAAVVVDEELPSEGRLLHSEKQTQQTQSQQQTQLQQQQPQQPPPPPQLVNTLESPVVTADKNQRSNAGGACNTNNDQRTLPVESSTSTAAAMSAAQHCHRMPGEAAAVVSEEQLLETTTSAMTDPEDSRVVNAVPPVGLDEEEVVSSSNQEEEPVDVDSEDSNSSCGTSAKSFEGAASSPSHDERIARIIGSVPIAQYEGSPKRYGPKPGYPKRVLSTSSNNSCSNEYEPSILMMPNKKADTLLPADNDEEHRQHQRQLEEQDQLEQHKTKLVNLSLSENGSPHSSTHSSTSSATFSSTDIHSSSSFSCPSNAHHHHQHQHQHHPLPKLSSTSHHHHFGTSKWANEAVGGGGGNNNNNIANNSNYDCRSNDEHCFSADCGGGNRTLDQSAIDTCDEGCGVAVAPSTRKVVAESNFPATEEIVKTILSLPSGQIDTEDDVDEDVTESSSDKATAGEEMLPPAIGAMIHSSSNSRTAAEPMYSSIASSGGYSAVDANKSSGYSSKRSLHSDDSESVTKSKTSISGSSGHGDRGSSLNRSSTSLKQQQSLSEANRSIGSQSTLDGSSVKQLNSAAQLASESASRNVPKSLRLEREGVVGSSSYHPHSQTRYQLEPSQSFESTDSSYRSSEQCPNSKDYYYGQSDDDLYLYGPGSKTSSGCYPGKAVAGGPTDRLTHSADRAIASGGSGNLNGGGSGFQEGTQSTKGTMMPPGGQRTSTQVPHLSYTALSPELSTSGLGGVGGGGSKFYGVLDSTYESTGDYPSDNNTESYESETAGKSGCDGGGATGDGGRIKVMPILEDGLSSGMPSSDELEYDEDDEGEDEMVAHEHDLDEYVNEYHSNNSRSNQCEPTSMMQSQPPPSTTTSTTGSYGNATSSTLRLDQMVNGTASGGGSANYNYGHSYGKQVPPSGGDYARPHKSSDGQMYRCGKGSYGLEMAGEMMTKTKEVSHDFYNGHHHHSNHHLHNHPVLDELTTGAATRSISNSSSNNSSMSTVRNSQLGPSSSSTGGKQQQQQHHHQSSSSSSPPPPPAPGGGSSHHHYHHYYHQSSAGAGSASASAAAASLGRQNYPNLSSSPTSLSPNSPGGRAGVGSAGPAVDGSGGLHHQQSSASSSSSSSHPSASQATAQKQQQQQSSAGGQHHYHQTAGSSAGAVSTVSAAAGSSSATATAAAASGVQQSPAEMASAVGTSTSPSSSHAATGGMLPPPNVRHHHDEDCDTDQETDRLLGSQRNDDRGFYDEKFRKSSVPPPEEDVAAQLKRSSTSREAFPPAVLIEGVLFRARYLGSTQLVCDGQPTKATRMMQAEEAVSRIKAPEGENQPSTEVDLFISTEKIMVLNTDLKEIMMDHALRTISYIADIGDLLVLMARRRTPIDDPNDNGIKRIPKMICHVFESEEAQYIAQSIGQAFQVAYMEFLKANGIEDSSFLKEMDYQEVLNSQEIFGNELEMFAKRERQKEVIVPKQKGEILGIVIVESGWGSMLPTVVIANMAQSSPSARCGQLNIGDQIIAINGISLVGLPLSTCQAYVKNTKNQTAVKFTIVPCAPVVEVKIKRPDTKYQLGFSVQNGVICSLLRGGIAERGGVRVGHRIIEINGQSVVAVPHDRIVNLLATSVGEIHMKTMPTSMFRLLTGQDSPSYM